jgi:drug/metabolite transporter (DMT)-like permease
LNKHVVELIVLGATWGFSFIFLRIAVPALGASSTTFMRLALAVVLLSAIAYYKGVRIPWGTHGKRFALFGLINTAVPFFLFGLASKALPAGYLAILNGTAALFSALIAIVWLKQPVTRAKVIGFLVGFVGVVILVGLAPLALTGAVIGSILAGLAGAVCYAFAGHLTARLFAGVSPYAVAAGSLAPAALALFPLAAMNVPAAQSFSPNVIYAVLFLGLITTGLAYFMYFRLMEVMGAVRVSTVAFLIPVFALIWGRVFLGEPITTANLVGGSLVLLGVAIVNGLLNFGDKVKK